MPKSLSNHGLRHLSEGGRGDGQSSVFLKPLGLFILLVSVWIVLGAAIHLRDGGTEYRSAHADHTEMHAGGSGELRHGHILLVGWLFAVLEVAIFVTLLSLGLRRRKDSGGQGWLLFFGGVVCAGVMTALFLSYRQYMTASEPSFLGPFPTPTSIMIFGIWLAPVIFVVLYVVFFDRWIVSEDDLKRFKHILEDRRRRAGKTS